MRHLKFDLTRSPPINPETVMRDLGITYLHYTPHSVADQWWFWCCENVPERLPSYLTELGLAPADCLDPEISQLDAQRIARLMVECVA